MKIKRLIIILTVTPFLLNCSEYSVRTYINKKSEISNLKRVGIVLRLSPGNRITKDEMINNIACWISNYKSTDKISIISDCSERISYSQSDQDRFYQLSGNDTFLKYKSIGVINLYLQNNEAELKNMMSLANLDGIMIYEINSILSTEMQFMVFDTVVAVFDRNLNIIYLDHQSDRSESDMRMLNKMKSDLMDRISNRLLEKLKSLSIISKRTD